MLLVLLFFTHAFLGSHLQAWNHVSLEYASVKDSGFGIELGLQSELFNVVTGNVFAGFFAVGVLLCCFWVCGGALGFFF